MTERIGASCCIAGGGPAGLLLRYLLARGGVRTAVLKLPARLSRRHCPPVDAARALCSRFRKSSRSPSSSMSGEAVARDFFRENAPRHVALLMQIVGQVQAAGGFQPLPAL